MKKMTFASFIGLTLVLSSISGCITTTSAPKAEEKIVTKDFFKGVKGCFLLYNMKSNIIEKVINEENCQERLPACSTFKVPLAVMAFDAGILEDENQVLKWDGVRRERPELNRDHDAKTWMKDSVVWFSQRLTPQLGSKRFQKYLQDFSYGNQDLSGGITQAWLTSPSKKTGALKISAYEQVEFMKSLWSNLLPVSARAMNLTKEITFLEISPRGFRLSGKTGSNYYDKAHKQHLGWFVSHLEKDDQEYIAVTHISDLKPTDKLGYGGPRAKQVTKEILASQGLW